MGFDEFEGSPPLGEAKLKALRAEEALRTSPNAPSKAEVLGTWVISVLSGHKRYAHVTAIRCDGVNPD